MDLSRIGMGEKIAAASGAALILVMFLAWFGYEIDSGVPGFGGAEADLSAWEWMSFLDILLFLAAGVAIAAAVARATGSMPADLPAPVGTILAAAGGLALVIVLFRLIIPGDGPLGDLADQVDTTRSIGVFLGLIAAGGMAYGGYTAMNEGAGEAPAAAPPPPTAPPPTTPPSESPPPA